MTWEDEFARICEIRKDRMYPLLQAAYEKAVQDVGMSRALAAWDRAMTRKEAPRALAAQSHPRAGGTMADVV